MLDRLVMRAITRRNFLDYSLGLVMLLGVFGAQSYFNTYRLLVTRLGVEVGWKIIFIVDLHIHSFGKIHEDILKIVRNEEPDVVLLGGDLIDEYTNSIDILSNFLSGLDANWKFAVLGNHEYWSGKASKVVTILKNHGFRVLNDSFELTPFGKVYGIDWREDRFYPSLSLDGIVLSHDPNAAAALSGKCIVLSGHTHGGVVINGIKLYSNSIYTRGLYNLNGGGILYVCRGLGQIFPLRPTSPIELLIIE